jgi:hypothetical protein
LDLFFDVGRIDSVNKALEVDSVPGPAGIGFFAGVTPLAVSTGVGSGGQNAIGTGTIGGMLSATAKRF